MKLLTASTSPFSLKVLVVAHELGLASRLEMVETHARPTDRNRGILNLNPMAQVPTLVLDDGSTVHDSRVICEYLNDMARGDLFLAGKAARWRALTEQSIGDAILAGAIIARYERTLRPPELRWGPWLEGHLDKIRTGLAYIEEHCPDAQRIDIGTIGFACAMAYIDFRFPDLDRRNKYPVGERWYAQFRERASMRAKPLSEPRAT